MGEIIRDISILESLLIAMYEGASDEKRMALQSVENLIAEKKEIISAFEKEFEKEFANDSQQAT